MPKGIKKSVLIDTLKDTGEVFKQCTKRVKILTNLSWSNAVTEEFFRQKEAALPKPVYNIDRKGFQEILTGLTQLSPKIAGEHPVLQWLRKTQESFIMGIQLLLAIETDNFFEISTALYGNSQSRLFSGEMSNLQLAHALSSRMSVCNLNDIAESTVHKSATEFMQSIEAKLKARVPMIPVKVELADDIVAKALAGMNRVRVRKDARFSDLELDALWNHEIESHCLTANNGSLHQYSDFLTSGGPRTTMTQEGLAVFYEVYGHTMSQRRFLSLCDRVHAVHLVEEGADFIQLYRWYRDRLETPRDAFYAAQRIFRGAKLSGKAPFTKDVVYLGGLLGVYNFLRMAVKNQNRLLVESLICGRMALEDVGTVAWLRSHGLLSPPQFIPDWLKNWEALLSYFSLSAVLGAVDLSQFQSYFDTHYTLEDWDLST